MIIGAFGNLTQIRDGLDILKEVDPTAAVVIRQYIIHVPEIKLAQLSPTQLGDITVLGWIEHTVEGGFFYTLAP